MIVTKIVIVLITALAIPSQCRIDSAISLFPFSGAISIWDISGANMIAYSSSLANTIQFYDFKSQLMTNISSPLANSNTDSISTHWLNTDVSYCFMVKNTNFTLTSFTSVASNSTFISNFELFAGNNFTTWGFGPTVN